MYSHLKLQSEKLKFLFVIKEQHSDSLKHSGIHIEMTLYNSYKRIPCVVRFAEHIISPAAFSARQEYTTSESSKETS